jgi:hypothetical protein
VNIINSELFFLQMVYNMAALASTEPQRSIFTGAITANVIRDARAIGTTTTLTSSRAIAENAEYSIRLATPEALREAAVATGIETEVIQDRIAKLALDPAHYGDYLTYKEGVLGQIRAEVLRTYLNTASMYEGVGYSKLQAEKMAAEVAKDVKESQMKIYHILFPHSGQKVKQVY